MASCFPASNIDAISPLVLSWRDIMSLMTPSIPFSPFLSPTNCSSTFPFFAFSKASNASAVNVSFPFGYESKMSSYFSPPGNAVSAILLSSSEDSHVSGFGGMKVENSFARRFESFCSLFLISFSEVASKSAICGPRPPFRALPSPLLLTTRALALLRSGYMSMSMLSLGAASKINFKPFSTFDSSLSSVVTGMKVFGTPMRCTFGLFGTLSSPHLRRKVERWPMGTVFNSMRSISWRVGRGSGS
mmetsp:Transcript_10036/g.14138  ORF Transcript_10036/g.14138 Transcript_10036/m.14138 type:complete len:245 (+) Transcript_10036:368-1102(+)